MTPLRTIISITPGPHCLKNSATGYAKPNENGSSKETHYPRTTKPSLRRSGPAIFVPCRSKIEIQSRRSWVLRVWSHGGRYWHGGYYHGRYYEGGYYPYDSPFFGGLPIPIPSRSRAFSDGINDLVRRRSRSPARRKLHPKGPAKPTPPRGQ
jgi:hypothetical protein